MLKSLFYVGVSLFAAACVDPVTDSELAVHSDGIEATGCDDCVASAFGEPGDERVIPLEMRCTSPTPAVDSYTVFGEIKPAGQLDKPARIEVFRRGNPNALSTLRVGSGGFSFRLNSTLFPNQFPGELQTCVTNPGVNRFSLDAPLTVIAR